MSVKITKSTVWEFCRYGLNSIIVLGFKLILTGAFVSIVNAYFAYFLVHVFVFFFSFFIHSSFSFKSKISRRTLKRYFFAVILIKVLDYFIFAFAFTYFEISAISSVLVATLLIAVVRFCLARKALVPAEH